MPISHACRIESEASRLCGMEEMTWVFFEEHLTNSMFLRDQDVPKSSSGGLTLFLNWSYTFPRSPTCNPGRACNGETFSPAGPKKQAHLSHQNKVSPRVMDCGEPNCNRPDYPLVSKNSMVWLGPHAKCKCIVCWLLVLYMKMF